MKGAHQFFNFKSAEKSSSFDKIIVNFKSGLIFVISVSNLQRTLTKFQPNRRENKEVSTFSLNRSEKCNSVSWCFKRIIMKPFIYSFLIESET